MKVKVDFVANSSSVSFIFEDKRKDIHPLFIYFPGITFELSHPDLGLEVSTYESYKAFQKWYDHPEDIKSSEVFNRKSLIRIIDTMSDNLSMSIMLEMLDSGILPKFDKGVRLIKWIDQADEKFLEEKR